MNQHFHSKVVGTGLAAALSAACTLSVGTRAGCCNATSDVSLRHGAALSDRPPLVFEPNLGQLDSSARFLARAGGTTLLLTDHGASIIPPGAEPLGMALLGSSQPAAIQGLEPTGGVSNYVLGADSRRWKTGIKHYRRVGYREVYRGIDLVYYGNPQSLEYDFILHPGADATEIRLAFTGVESLEIDPTGDLLLITPAGRLTQSRPTVYQERHGERTTIAARYVHKGRLEVGIQISDYDRRLALVIDPILVYSTYLGGSQNEIAHGVAVDGSGNAYVTGQTCSTNFPTSVPFQGANAGGCDAFVTKINASGSALVYSTYLGGSKSDEGRGLAVDASGNVYLAGTTCSSNFPLVNPYQALYRGACDAFVAKLNATGSALLYSTYLGGAGLDRPYRLVVNANGNAFVTGETTSANFPTVRPIQAAIGGMNDAFVSKFSETGKKLIYSTYLGGAGRDFGFGIAVDTGDNAHVTGRTASSNFPIVNALQGNNAGQYDAFVSKIDAQGAGFVYSTYMGGQLWDAGLSILTDANATAYLSGYAASPDFPLANPFQPMHGGDRDAIVAQISPSGTLLFSSYLGGSGRDMGDGLGLDAAGNMYVAGVTSGDFPVLNPIQASFGGGLRDVFLTKVGSALSIDYSTYLGGSGDEEALSVAVEANGGAQVTGYTRSFDFPVALPLQPRLRGSQDAFVVSVN